MNPTLKGAPNIARQSYNISLLHTTLCCALFSIQHCILLYDILYCIITREKTRPGVSVLGRMVSIYLLTEFFTDTLGMSSMAGRMVS